MSESKKIVKILQKKSFSGKDIMNLIDGKANMITYPELSRFSHIDQVLGRHGACVILYLTKQNYGHWCCMFRKYRKPKTIIFFDSYGTIPDDELLEIPAHMNKKLGQNRAFLSQLLLDSGYDVEYNDKKLQKFAKDVNTCGRWTGFRLAVRRLDTELFSILCDQMEDPDAFVTAITAEV